MKENNEWNLVGKETKRKKRRIKRQISVFLISIIFLLICLFINYFLVKNYDMNLIDKIIISIQSKSNTSNNINSENDNNEDISINFSNNNANNNVVVSNTESTNNIMEKSNYIKNEAYTIDNTIIICENPVGNLALRLVEINNQNNETNILYDIEGINTEPGIIYSIEVKNSDGKIISNENQNQDFIGIQYISMENVKLDDILQISIKEIVENSGTILRSGSGFLDMKKDVSKKDIKQISKTITRWKDINFSINENSKIYSLDSTNTSSKLYKQSYFSVQNYVQYGDYMYFSTMIQLLMINNVNNLTSLDDILKGLENSEKMGYYNLMDNYTLFISEEKNGGVTEEINVTYQQINELIDNKTIEVNGKKYTVDDFDSYLPNLKYDNIEKIMINGVDARKFHNTETNDIEYVFMYKGNIYKIISANDNNSIKELSDFINSISFN